MIIVSNVKSDISIGANSFNAGQYTPLARSGYKPIATAGYAHNNQYAVVFNCIIDGNGNIAYGIANKSNSDITITFLDIKVIYVKVL